MADVHVIEDSSFLVSVLNSNDSLHVLAMDTMNVLNSYIKRPLTYVYPETVICETVFTLMKVGINPETIRDRINKLSMLPKVIFINTDTMSILRYVSRYYNKLANQSPNPQLSKTSDYLIGCVCNDFDGLLISGDSQMISAVSCFGMSSHNFSSEPPQDLIPKLNSK